MQYWTQLLIAFHLSVLMRGHCFTVCYVCFIVCCNPAFLAAKSNKSYYYNYQFTRFSLLNHKHYTSIRWVFYAVLWLSLSTHCPALKLSVDLTKTLCYYVLWHRRWLRRPKPEAQALLHVGRAAWAWTSWSRVGDLMPAYTTVLCSLVEVGHACRKTRLAVSCHVILSTAKISSWSNGMHSSWQTTDDTLTTRRKRKLVQVVRNEVSWTSAC